MFNANEEAYFLTLEQERRAERAKQAKDKPSSERQFNETTAVFLRRLAIEQPKRR